MKPVNYFSGGKLIMTSFKFFTPLFTLAAFVFGVAGCTTHAAKDPRSEPELVRIATVEPTQNGDHAFTGVVTSSASARRVMPAVVPGKGIAVSRSGRSPFGSTPADSETIAEPFFGGAGGPPGM